eukprot:COSAG01_NODE_2746_length_7150_cov_2.735924_6_plen_43_part_00
MEQATLGSELESFVSAQELLGITKTAEEEQLIHVVLCVSVDD